MYDLRNLKIIDLKNSICLKEKTTYKSNDKSTGKKLIAKFISNYDDTKDNDFRLINEFKKLVLLSGEPEIATVYYLAQGKTSDETKSCYIMDFIEGESLGKFLDKRKSINYEVLIDILLQLTLGLEKCHNYEIYHRDLHLENIIINKYGYIKIIDFLWADFIHKDELNNEKDVNDFKKIVSILFNKCKKEDKPRFQLIYNYCLNINNIKGLKKELELIDSISFEYSLLNEKSITILSLLFEHTGNIYDLLKVLNITETEIPNRFIPQLTDEEKVFIKQEKDKGVKIEYTDTRILKVRHNLNQKIEFNLHHLTQSNLIDWSLRLKNNGEKFIGPYEFNLEISFTSKFMKWKKIHELLELIKMTESDIIKLILK